MLIVEPEATKLPRRKRRSWTLEEKRRIVDESLMDGASIAEIARRHDLNANQFFTRRRHRAPERGSCGLSFDFVIGARRQTHRNPCEPRVLYVRANPDLFRPDQWVSQMYRGQKRAQRDVSGSRVKQVRKIPGA